jgi:hypothetical protein
MFVVTCLIFLFTSCLSYLMATCMLSCYGFFVRIHSCFTSLDIMVCVLLKYLLICLVKHTNFESHA